MANKRKLDTPSKGVQKSRGNSRAKNPGPKPPKSSATTKQIKEVLKDVGSHVLKEAGKEILKTAVEGIFNDDSDYSFSGYMPEIPANFKRPMDVETMSQFIDNITQGPVPRVSRLNLSLLTSSYPNALSISAQRALAALRTTLRSNLIETEQDIVNYLRLVIPLIALVKQYNRSMAVINETSGVDPHYNDVLNTPTDPYQRAFALVTRPKWTDPKSELFASNKNLEPMVDATLKLLRVPEKYVQWFDWYLNSIFVDDNSIHKQVYINDVRQMDVVTVSGDLGNTQISVTEYIDPLSLDNPLQFIYDQARAILSVYAVLIADIDKSELSTNFTSLSLYSDTRVLQDKSYFEYLVNSYAWSDAMTFPASMYQAPFSYMNYRSGTEKTGFMRYDKLDGVPEDKVGPLQAMAKICTPVNKTAPTLVTPISQSVVIYVPLGVKIPLPYNNVSDRFNVTTIMQEVPEAGLYGASMYSFTDSLTSAYNRAVTTTDTTTYKGSTSARIASEYVEGINTVYMDTDFLYGHQLVIRTSGGSAISDVNIRQLVARVNDSNGNPMSYIWMNIHIAASGINRVNSTSWQLDVPSGSIEYEVTSDVNGSNAILIATTSSSDLSYIGTVLDSVGSLVTLRLDLQSAAGARILIPVDNSDLRSCFVMGYPVEYVSTFWADWEIRDSVSSEYTQWVTSDDALDATVRFISDKFDYTIPVFMYRGHVMAYGAPQTMMSNVLLKESYQPTLLELNSVYVTLELMLLGLLSIV